MDTPINPRAPHRAVALAAIMVGGVSAKLPVVLEFPPELETLETRLASARQAATPARVSAFQVKRLVEPPTPNLAAEFKALESAIRDLHRVTNKAARVAIHYRLSARCGHGASMAELEYALRTSTGNDLKTFFWKVADAAKPNSTLNDASLLPVGDRMLNVARECFEELADAKACLGYEPKQLGELHI